MASEHIPLWQTYVANLKREHDIELADAERRVSEAHQALAQRPEKIVEKYINQQDIVAAEEKADRAFRSRQVAWRALSELGMAHTELPGDRCRCGKHRRSCNEAAVVTSVAGLPAWEARQAAEHRAGRRHFLPDGHPALLDHRWSSDAEAEDFDQAQ